MMMYLRLDDIFSDVITNGGIFTLLQILDVPWQDENIAPSLDLLYHGNHGERIISPLVVKLLDTDNELSTENRSKLALTIYNLFSVKWSKLWATLSLEYNPISNYDMEEHETPAEVTSTVRPAETTVDSKPAKIITEDGISAFNSSDYVDDQKTTVSGDPLDKGSESLTVDEAGSNVLTVQNERVLTRSGNIGVTTSQQMIQSERDLWKWNFFESVFTDLDYVLTLHIY